MRLRNEQTGTIVHVPDDQARRMLGRGWMDTDQLPAAAPPATAGSAVGLPDDKDQLIRLAETEGVAVDRRWGINRLRAAITAAREANHG